MTPGRHAAARERSPSWWAGVVEWRNWRLPVKLGAVLVVPALLAVALGVVQIQRDVERANSYADVQRLVKLRGGLMPLISDLQMERTMSAERLRGGASADTAMLRQQTGRVDRARAAVTRTMERAPRLEGASALRYREAFKLLDGLPALRRQVSSAGIGSWTAVTGYSKIINGLLDLDQALGSRFGEPQLSGPATALYDLEVVQEQVHLQHVILMEGREPGKLDDDKLIRALAESAIRMGDKLSDFRAVATAAEQRAYQRTVTGPEVERRSELLRAALYQSAQPGTGQGGANTSPTFPAGEWNRSSERTGELIERVEKGLADQLRVTSARLQDQTSDRAGAESVLLFAVLLLALAIGIGIARHLLRSLTVLRSTALEVAERRLPEAVASIRDGEASSTSISAVPVHTTEEFGQLARAFDAVHGQAVRLAAEQAALRSDLRDTLVNLSRRSQSLVDRLLRLMEELELHEEDPDQLANLFKLDHLATRMRRNNENLMVLCGSTPVRPSEQRVPLDTVLRAAVSEIEHYQRVVVEPVPSAEVIGYAAGDLARMIAELLDNATAFSPPQTQVVISNTLRLDGSALIEIHDEGFGMSGAELAKAHRRVAGDASVEVPTSRQMGLSVVGRLARRHGVTVELASDRATGAGLRAGVLVPAKLMLADKPALTGGELVGKESALPTRRTATRAPEPVRTHRADGGATAAPLPRRAPETARSIRAGDSPAGPGRPRGPLPSRPGSPRAFTDPQQTQGLPRRKPAAGTARPAPGGKDPLPKRNVDRPVQGGAPADGRAAAAPGQPLVPPQRSRPAPQRQQEAAPSPWFAPAEPAAPEAAPAAPRGEAAPDEREPAGLPAVASPRRPAPAAPGSPDQGRPESVGDRRRADHETSGIPEAAGRPPAAPRQAGPAQVGPAQVGPAQVGPAQAGLPQAGLPQAGQAQNGQPQAGQAQNGQPRAGQAQNGQPQAGPAQQVPPARQGPSQTGPSRSGLTQAGLPRRVPRQSQTPGRGEPRPAGDRPTPRPAGDEAAARLDAGRTHTFLSNYQSGIRRANPDET
ncbi:sensor histidine kinase [Streptomyces hygroscopicus]|uniref:sensor histidine kinase n=1 Tax=Streptomyces hygroscopicus TaxID=1912 RepID=UPI000767B68E|nr:nitrate- and nitrite sensing domain-containing protein [Streptomyces hygroscopicus]